MAGDTPTKPPQRLTMKEQAFIEAYLGQCRGNATRAILAAGYRYSIATARTEGYRTLKKPDIRQAIDAALEARKKAAIADAEERDAILTTIARRKGQSAKDRIAAVKELNKCSGRHSIKHIHDGKLTLEQVLGESRRLPAK